MPRNTIPPYSTMIDFVGGSNDGLEYLDSLQPVEKRFIRDADGNTLPGFPAEVYRRTKACGEDIYLHEGLDTPEKVEAAVARWQARKREVSEAFPMARAAGERDYRQRMDPLNEDAAWWLLTVVERTAKTNEWQVIPRQEFDRLIRWKSELGFKSLPAIRLGGALMTVWWYPPFFEADADPEKSEVSHAVMAMCRRWAEVTFIAKVAAFETWPPPPLRAGIAGN